MRQHAINLLPTSVQARTAKGAAISRWITLVLCGGVALGALLTWSRFRLAEARDRYDAARVQADIVLQAEKKQEELEQTLRDIDKRVERYALLSHPIELSRVTATIINLMPPSAVLDRIDIQAGARRAVKTARKPTPNAKADQPRPPRVVTGEMTGFAASDTDIIDFVAKLAEQAPLSDVSLDQTRHRVVRDQNAREFRISFKIDLESEYVVALPEEADDAP